MSQHMPAAGDLAPDFTLFSTSGKVTLSSYRGQKNVLLAFFPMAFTDTCTSELCGLSNEYSAFASQDVEVIPISADFTPSLKAFKAQHHMTVELVSDARRDVARAYGVLNEEKFFANRAYFLIDKTGTVRWAFQEPVNNHHRQNAEILEQIAKLAP